MLSSLSALPFPTTGRHVDAYPDTRPVSRHETSEGRWIMLANTALKNHHELCMVFNKITIDMSFGKGLAVSEAKWETETSVSRNQGSGSHFGGKKILVRRNPFPSRTSDVWIMLDGAESGDSRRLLLLVCRRWSNRSDEAGCNSANSKLPMLCSSRLWFLRC